MNNLTEFLEAFISKDREAERRREQDYLELIRCIKSELKEIRMHDEYAVLEEVH